jgi:trehalose synthase
VSLVAPARDELRSVPGANGRYAVKEVAVSPLRPERLLAALRPEQAAALTEVTGRGRKLLAGRVVWSVNSTPRGGGVAEMLLPLIAYARGANVDARWMVIAAEPEFFAITKRIHNRLHGADGDGGPLGPAEAALYERCCERSAAQLARLLRPGDIVLLHDPQTAGMAPHLAETGAKLVWRCHVGLDSPNADAREAWEFLLPYVQAAGHWVFSRRAFAWDGLDPARIEVIPPSIDPFTPKNQPLLPRTVRGILAASGLGHEHSRAVPIFQRVDGTPGRVDRGAQVHQDRPIRWEAGVLTQVSRWDRLKDPVGVVEAFNLHVAPRGAAELLLAGPETAAVADDPEGAQVLEEVKEARLALPPDVRERVHLAELPMADAEENAAIVNAIQRESTVVAQKSLAEGFGLTVSEAMWKGTPVIGSSVGGIQDQIEDGVTGLLVDPADLEGFGAAAHRLLDDPVSAAAIGERGRERVQADFLPLRHLGQYVDLFERLVNE